MAHLNPIHGYEDLTVWQLGMDLAEGVYQLTGDFPAEERFGLTNQLRRAAISIAANIAEGHSRNSTKEYQRFLSISAGSLAEVKTYLKLAERLHYGQLPKIRELIELADQERRMLRGLQRSLRAKFSDP
jgi:four helix bundle protein